jgi:hypothetical protein
LCIDRLFEGWSDFLGLFFGRGGAVLKSSVMASPPPREGEKKKDKGRGEKGGRGGNNGVFFE